MGKGRPWSKLQTTLYGLLLNKELNLQIHSTVYPVRDGNKGKGEKRGMPRIWFTLGKDIVWDWPKDFMVNGRFNWSELHGWSISKDNADKKNLGKYFNPHDEKYGRTTTTVANLIEEYINTSVQDIRDNKDFKFDKWGFTEILKAADRRAGRGTLNKFKEVFKNPVALKLIEKRLELKISDLREEDFQ